MKTLAYAVIAVLVIVIAGLFLKHVVRSTLGTASVSLAPGISTGLTSVPQIGALQKDSVPLQLQGTVIMDGSAGYPAVPYISYINQNNNVSTKQLIFADERGCLPSAGDIPCVPTYPVYSAYPQLRDGEHILASGFIRENRFLVTSLSVQ